MLSFVGNIKAGMSAEEKRVLSGKVLCQSK